MSSPQERIVKGVEVPLPLAPSATTENPPARATTTSEQDRRTLGQRRINILWEVTQGLIALALIGTACYALLSEMKLPAEYWLLLGIIVQSYFQRTNHTKIGGVGGTDSR